MMELIWESRDSRTQIYRRGKTFWLAQDGWEVMPATSYAFAQRYALLELLCGKEEPFPDLQHESGFD